MRRKLSCDGHLTEQQHNFVPKLVSGVDGEGVVAMKSKREVKRASDGGRNRVQALCILHRVTLASRVADTYR